MKSIAKGFIKVGMYLLALTLIVAMVGIWKGIMLQLGAGLLAMNVTSLLVAFVGITLASWSLDFIRLVRRKQLDRRRMKQILANMDKRFHTAKLKTEWAYA